MEKQTDSSLLVPIKEFSDFTGVKQSALRYFDDLDLFKPSERGDNNYRYYSLMQIQTIKLIETLKDLGIPLKKIKKMIISRSPKSTIDMLTQREIALTAELRKLQESFSLIHNIRTLIQGSMNKEAGMIEVCYEDEKRFSLGQENEFRKNRTYHRAYSEYYRFARNMRLNLGFHIGGYFDTPKDFITSPSMPQRFFSLDPNGLDIKPAGSYLTAYTRGDYGVIGDMPQRMLEYAKENNLKLCGPVYHIYPLNEVCYPDNSMYLSKITIKIAD